MSPDSQASDNDAYRDLAMPFLDTLGVCNIERA